MTYLLDTNHCSRIIAGDIVLLQALRQHLEDGVATSAIVTRIQQIESISLDSWI